MSTSTHMSNSSVADTHSRFYWLLSDTWILTRRSLMHIFKNTDQIMGLTIQPIMFMLLFYYVFGGAVNTGDVAYLDFLIAGILIQSLAFGSLTTSLSVAADLQRGITDRFRSLPIANSAAMTGHVLADLVRNLIQTIILLGVGFLLGFRPEAGLGAWLLIGLILVLFTFAISWVAAIMGLLAKTIEAVQWLGFLVVFPFTFASAAYVPTETMASGLRWFAANQPVTHVIEAVRALLLGEPMGTHGTYAIIWCVAIAAVAIPVATYLFRRYSLH